MQYKVIFKDILQPSLELLFAFFVIIFGLKANGLAVAYTVSYFITAVLLLYISKRLTSRYQEKNGFDNSFSKLLGYSIPIMGGDLLLNLLPKITTFIIAFYHSTKMVGIYSIVLRISMIYTLILMSFNLIFAPVISELYSQNSIEKLQSIFKEITNWIVLLCLPILGICLIFPSYILGIFGKEFIHGTYPLVILSLGQITNIFSGPVTFTLIMIGRSKEYFIISFMTLITCGLISIILIYRYGIIGAALADSTVGAIMSGFVLFRVYKLLKIHPFNNKLLILISAFIIGGLFAIYIKGNLPQIHGVSKEIFGIAGFIIVYFFISFKSGLYLGLFNNLFRNSTAT
jgi:O-antigen/teichoic acid export membrane protein